MIAEEIHDSLEQEKLLPDKHRECRRGSRGTKDQLPIDKTVLNDCEKRYTNLSMPWIDERKPYDFILHSWVNEWSRKVPTLSAIPKNFIFFRIADKVSKVLGKSMKQWKLLLIFNGEDLGEVDVKRGIFLGNILLPLMFFFSIISLLLILKKSRREL